MNSLFCSSYVAKSSSEQHSCHSMSVPSFIVTLWAYPLQSYGRERQTDKITVDFNICAMLLQCYQCMQKVYSYSYVVLICKNQALCVNTSYCSYLIYVLSIQSDKDKQLTAQLDQHNDKVSGVSKRLPTFLNRMLSFKVKLEETKVCHVSVILQAHNQSFSRGGSKSGMIT